MKKEMTREERIAYFERLMEKAEETLAAKENAGPLIRELEIYYTSPEWKSDYAADEAGELPANLKRGVLSEDGLFNLLDRFRETNGPEDGCAGNDSAEGR